MIEKYSITLNKFRSGYDENLVNKGIISEKINNLNTDFSDINIKLHNQQYIYMFMVGLLLVIFMMKSK